MSSEKLIDSLMAIHPKGYDLSLDRISSLLDRLGNPQRRIPPAIHVAGTNGKGSTIAFCRAILEASGKTVHVHTSPHLVNWHERFRMAAPGGGHLVSDNVLEDAIARTADANGGTPITVFEILSAAMFLLFSEHHADFSLIEVGLGGRFDATNVLTDPAACVITPVALDHQAHLGDTLAEIAFEKAGIIKPGVNVIVGLQDEASLEVIRKKAAECQANLCVAGEDYDFHKEANRFIYQDENGLLDLPLPGLSGDHQLGNAALAIATLRSLSLKISNEDYETAMTSVRWPGRMQLLKSGAIVDRLGEGTEIWVDGGHNPAAARVVADALAERNSQHRPHTIMVCAMLTTKEPQGYFDAFGGLVDEIIMIPVNSSDAGFDPAILAGFAEKAGHNAVVAKSLDGAIDMIASKNKNAPVRIIFAGTLYLAGEVLAANNTPPK